MRIDILNSILTSARAAHYKYTDAFTLVPPLSAFGGAIWCNSSAPLSPNFGIFLELLEPYGIVWEMRCGLSRHRDGSKQFRIHELFFSRRILPPSSHFRAYFAIGSADFWTFSVWKHSFRVLWRTSRIRIMKPTMQVQVQVAQAQFCRKFSAV